MRSIFVLAVLLIAVASPAATRVSAASAPRITTREPDHTIANPRHREIATQAGICVRNGTENAYLFVAEAQGADRQTQILAPGGKLCVFGAETGVVSVFTDQDALEGCSRLAISGQEEVLLQYTEFDRCAWRSNTE